MCVCVCELRDSVYYDRSSLPRTRVHQPQLGGGGLGGFVHPIMLLLTGCVGYKPLSSRNRTSAPVFITPVNNNKME